MTQAAAGAPPQPEVEGQSEEPGLRARLRARLRRSGQRLVPRTRKQQALYALLFLIFLVTVFEWRASNARAGRRFVTEQEVDEAFEQTAKNLQASAEELKARIREGFTVVVK